MRLFLGVGGLAKLLEADRCLDGVAQDGLAGLDVAGQHRIHTFAPDVLERFCFMRKRRGNGGALPPLEKGRVGVGIISNSIPTRLAALADLPFSRGGNRARCAGLIQAEPILL
jgi:hypothetical protein